MIGANFFQALRTFDGLQHQNHSQLYVPFTKLNINGWRWWCRFSCQFNANSFEIDSLFLPFNDLFLLLFYPWHLIALVCELLLITSDAHFVCLYQLHAYRITPTSTMCTENGEKSQQIFFFPFCIDGIPFWFKCKKKRNLQRLLFPLESWKSNGNTGNLAFTYSEAVTSLTLIPFTLNRMNGWKKESKTERKRSTTDRQKWFCQEYNRDEFFCHWIFKVSVRFKFLSNDSVTSWRWHWQIRLVRGIQNKIAFVLK